MFYVLPVSQALLSKINLNMSAVRNHNTSSNNGISLTHCEFDSACRTAFPHDTFMRSSVPHALWTRWLMNRTLLYVSRGLKKLSLKARGGLLLNPVQANLLTSLTHLPGTYVWIFLKHYMHKVINYFALNCFSTK